MDSYHRWLHRPRAPNRGLSRELDEKELQEYTLILLEATRTEFRLRGTSQRRIEVFKLQNLHYREQKSWNRGCLQRRENGPDT